MCLPEDMIKKIKEKENGMLLYDEETGNLGLKLSKNDQIISKTALDFRKSFQFGFTLKFNIYVPNQEFLDENPIILSFGNQTFIQLAVSLYDFHLLSSNDTIQVFKAVSETYQIKKWNERKIIFDPLTITLSQYINGIWIRDHRIVDHRALENLIGYLVIGKPSQLKYEGNPFEGYISNIHCFN